VKIQIPLSNYSGQDIYLAFKYRNNGGQSGHVWSVDDFNIYNLDTYTDAELVAITAPNSGTDLTNEETVVVKIKNNGTHNITNFPLQLKVDEQLLATEFFTGYIPSMQVAVYLFSHKIDLSVEDKTYTITVAVDLEADATLHNNSKTITVTHLPNSVISYENNPLVAWVIDNQLFVEGMQCGERWRIYSAIGTLVSQGIVYDKTVKMRLNTRGVYIFQSGKNVIKVVY
jgi:hypothetical protein